MIAELPEVSRRLLGQQFRLGKLANERECSAKVAGPDRPMCPLQSPPDMYHYVMMCPAASGYRVRNSPAAGQLDHAFTLWLCSRRRRSSLRRANNESPGCTKNICTHGAPAAVRATRSSRALAPALDKATPRHRSVAMACGSRVWHHGPRTTPGTRSPFKNCAVGCQVLSSLPVPWPAPVRPQSNASGCYSVGDQNTKSGTKPKKNAQPHHA
jgi:hypothetical protein